MRALAWHVGCCSQMPPGKRNLGLQKSSTVAAVERKGAGRMTWSVGAGFSEMESSSEVKSYVEGHSCLC